MRRTVKVAPVAMLVVAGAVGVLCSPMAASAAILKDLIEQNGTITQGDKLFSNFQATITGSPPGSFFVNPALIDVVGITTPGGDYGLRFQSVSPGAPILSAGPGLTAWVDMLLSFDVTVVNNPVMKIHDVSLKFDAEAPDDGLAQIVESVLSGPVIVAQIAVDYPSPMEASAILPGLYPTVHIIKDIAVLGGANGEAKIYSFEQAFSQIPEPATLVFVAGGALVMLRRRVRRGLTGRSSSVVAVVVGLLAAMLMPGQASAAPLSILAGDPLNSIVQADKVFDQFHYTVNTSIGRVVFDPAQIEVKGITLGDEHGIQFAGLLAAIGQAAAPGHLKVTIDYRVTVTDPNLFIDDLSLGFNGFVTGPGGYAKVDETAWIAGPTAVGTASVATPAPLSDHILLAGAFKSLHVTKTIELFSAGPTGATTISLVNQTFSQIPEPATVALALAGLAFWRRRRTI